MLQQPINDYLDSKGNILQLRRMLARLLELQSVTGMTEYERGQVKASIKALSAAIGALEVQVYA